MSIRFKSLASSSLGNCYHLEVAGQEGGLLLECGVPWKDIQEGLKFKTSGLAGCLCTHEHGDHIKSVHHLLKAGIDCYMSAGTAAALKIGVHYFVHIVRARKQFMVGPWAVLPFAAVHDHEACPSAEPLGFLIVGHGARVLAATDTAYIKHKFHGLTHIAVECNYQLEILNRNVESGAISVDRKERIMATHFGLAGVLEFLAANDLSQCQEIHLLHMSDGNCNAAECIAAVQGATGIPTYEATR